MTIARGMPALAADILAIRTMAEAALALSTEGPPSGQLLTIVEAPSNSLALSAEAHSGRAVSVTLPNTFVTFVNFAALTSGFNCQILNRSATNIGFTAGIGNPSGHQYLRPGGLAVVQAWTDSAGEIVRWFGGPSE